MELLIFYWCFSSLVLWGVQDDEEYSLSLRMSTAFVCIILGGLLFPFFIGKLIKRVL